VEVHQIRYAVAVAAERSFTSAAARLRVAQPSLSRAIAQLERELGAPLFHRGPGHARVEPTSEGVVLLPFLQRVMADLDATAAEARSLAGLASGRLAIGATPSLATRFLPARLAEFHSEFPGIELVVIEAGSQELVAHTATSHVDLALVVLPVDDASVSTTILFDDPLVLAVAPGHRLASRRRVRVSDLDQLPLIAFRTGYDLRTVTDRACREAGVQPRVVAEGGEMDGVLALAAAGLGAAVIPALAAPTDGTLRAIPINAPPLKRTIALARRADRPLTHAARQLERHLTPARQPRLIPRPEKQAQRSSRVPR
jgi:DNA-binding transcriptional LysR family regulator